MTEEIRKWWGKRSWYGKLAVILVLIITVAFVTPFGRSVWNSWFFNVQKADDATNYRTVKQVEDSCRAMISSYTAIHCVFVSPWTVFVGNDVFVAEVKISANIGFDHIEKDLLL